MTTTPEEIVARAEELVTKLRDMAEVFRLVDQKIYQSTIPLQAGQSAALKDAITADHAADALSNLLSILSEQTETVKQAHEAYDATDVPRNDDGEDGRPLSLDGRMDVLQRQWLARAEAAETALSASREREKVLEEAGKLLLSNPLSREGTAMLREALAKAGTRE